MPSFSDTFYIPVARLSRHIGNPSSITRLRLYQLDASEKIFRTNVWFRKTFYFWFKILVTGFFLSFMKMQPRLLLFCQCCFHVVFLVGFLLFDKTCWKPWQFSFLLRQPKTVNNRNCASRLQDIRELCICKHLETLPIHWYSFCRWPWADSGLLLPLKIL